MAGSPPFLLILRLQEVSSKHVGNLSGSLERRGKITQMVYWELRSQKKNLFYCKGDWTLDQVAQKGCGVSIPTDIQSATGHCPVQPCAPVKACLSSEFGLDDLQQSLPTAAILWFSDSTETHVGS